MKKKFIKIIIWIIVILSITSFSFATEISTWWNEPSFISQIADLLNIIWLPFAIIAWKLFTNDLVYWSAFKIDAMLWHVWQFSRTIANYILWFTFIVWILLFFVWKLKDIIQLLWKIALASILVNASWFILWAILDVSTILLMAVWALPMHLIWTSATAPVEKIKYCSQIEIDPQGISTASNWVKNLTICKEWSEKQMEAEKFFKMMNNLTWPLIFIGSSILNVDKNWNIDPNQVNWNTWIKKSSKIRNMLHIMIIILFVVPIILLVIIWIIRVFWLWIYISFSPLLVLDYVFWWKYVSSKNKNLKLSNVIWLIFQPVLVVLAMWIAVIFLATVQTAFIWWNDDEAKKALWICNEKSLCINKKPVVTMEWSLTKNFMEEVGWAFGYIILTILSFVLMWGLIKMAFHSTEITAWIADRTFKFAEESMKTVPIIPTPWWWAGIWAMEKLISSRLMKKWFDVKATEQANKLIWGIDKIFGTGQNSIWITMETKWQNEFSHAVSRIEVQKTLKEFINDVKTNKPNDIVASDPYFWKVISTFFNKSLAVDSSWTKAVLARLKLKEKDISDPNKLMHNDYVKQFIRWIIIRPNLLDNNTDLFTVYNQAIKWVSSQLNDEIKDIK